MSINDRRWSLCGLSMIVAPTGDWVRLDDHEAELAALREQLAEAESRRLEADIAYSIKESDLDDAQQTIQALGENPMEADTWAIMKRQRDDAEKRAEAAEAVASAVTNALTIGDKDFATLGLWSDIDKNGDGKQKYVARVTHPYHGRADSDACESIAEAIQSASKAMATRQIRKQKGTDDATD